MNQDLLKSARIALKDCLDLKKEEIFLVIFDEPKRKIAQAFFQTGKEMGAETLAIEIIPRRINGEEPPMPLAEMWKLCQVYVAPTSKSLTHTTARRNAVEGGARGATLPDATADMLKRCLPVDYKKMSERCDKLVDILTEGKEVHITTALGTDLKFSLEGRKGEPDKGIYNKPCMSGNLPAGEAFTAPLEGTSNGIMVVDGAMLGVMKTPITFQIKDGYVTEITGGQEAEQLKKLIDEVGYEARNIAEFGIGLNENAIFTGNVLEDEKIFKTIHIALGNNYHFGGKIDVPFHMDGIIKMPTVVIDGKMIMKEGEHLV